MADTFAANVRPSAEALDAAAGVCRGCPVRRECADYAARVKCWGLWGGQWLEDQRLATQAA